MLPRVFCHFEWMELIMQANPEDFWKLFFPRIQKYPFSITAAFSRCRATNATCIAPMTVRGAVAGYDVDVFITAEFVRLLPSNHSDRANDFERVAVRAARELGPKPQRRRPT